LDVIFDRDQRRFVDQAFEQLKAAGMLVPTYDDLVNPELWVELTDAGRAALATGELDDLDAALACLDSHLIEIRQGIHVALASTGPDSLRQAAHSARELIDHTLHALAPDERIRAAEWFQPETTSSSGVTRRHRIKYALLTNGADQIDVESDYINANVDVVLATNRLLMGNAHLRQRPDRREIEDLIANAERALRRLLLANRRT
jgi:hypothetical protein